MDIGNDVKHRLQQLMRSTGYDIIQHNGQRKFGPPPDWSGPPPPKGCEVFVGKLPREVFEDELVPIFARVGKIFELRLMMDFSGSNRGYAFVTYMTRAEASAAVRELNDFEIRPGRQIGVVKSVDNCRLFVGGIPKEKTKEEVAEELSKKVAGIVDVILYKNCFDKRYNRGFAFVEFTSHRAAAMARRFLVPGCVKLWDHEVAVDWAEPEPDFDDEQMKKVKVLHVRNFQIKTTPDKIQSLFENAINAKIQRVKKIYDYAFIHFFERAHAKLAISKLQNTEIDGSNIEICWAKPVDREVYKIQKQSKGNAKFNNSLNLSQTLLLYKQHLEKREYENSPKDEGIGSVGAEDTATCESSYEAGWTFPYISPQDAYCWAPAKLSEMCNKYMWAAPLYKYQKYTCLNGVEVFVCRLYLPHVGLPLVNPAQHIGPIETRSCFTQRQAQEEAAGLALHYINCMRPDFQCASSAILPPVYQPVAPPPVPNVLNLPRLTPFVGAPLFMRSSAAAPLPLTTPTLWH